MSCPITVVMITRNRAAGLEQALEKLLALPERPPVIVVVQGIRLAANWAPGALPRAAACFERHPRLALIAARSSWVRASASIRSAATWRAVRCPARRTCPAPVCSASSPAARSCAARRSSRRADSIRARELDLVLPPN